MKKLIQNFALVCCTLAIMLVCAEGVLHFLPVSSGVGFMQVNDTQPTFKAHPNREITYSKDWNFKLVVKKRVNNAGFLNSNDYVQDDPRPLLAVVGDSYIEALQLNDDAPYFELLNKAQNKLRVYSFGFSGAPLSQYLIWAKYAKENYNNDYLIINVVGNDFDESLKKYKFAAGFYHYAPTGGNQLQLERCDLRSNKIRDVAKKSKLVGYLMRNIAIEGTAQRLKRLIKGNKPSYGTVPSNASNEQYLWDSYQAIDAFFRDLPQYSGVLPKNTAFVIDDRSTTYEQQPLQALEKTYLYKMKEYFIHKANTFGYTVFDMAGPFGEHFKQHGEHFEFPFDYHWNEVGHRVVAQTIRTSSWWQDLMASQKSS